MAILIVLWPYLLTTKLRSVIRHNLGHSMVAAHEYRIKYHIVECYCTCIIEILSYFFILQCLATSKMRTFQTLKLSQFHKEKTCWTVFVFVFRAKRPGSQV